jgi:hypothetical protein
MKKFSFGQCVAVVLLCTGLASTGIVWYVNQLTHKLETETVLILKEFAAQDVRHVEMQISEDLELLYSMATSLGMYPNITKQELIAFLQTQREQNHYKNLEFALPDGTTTLDDGSFLELSKTHHFQEAMKGIVNISNRGQDMLDRSNILVEAAPVKQNGEIIGVLMGTRNTADFAKLLDMQSFNGMGYSLLVRANGDKVIESFHKNAISGLYNIFDMPDDPDHALRHQVLSDFTARKSGVITYHSAKRGTLYISYQPLSVNDWYLISVVPASHITKVTNNFVTLLPLLCLLVALAAFALGAYLCYAWPTLRQKLTSPQAA